MSYPRDGQARIVLSLDHLILDPPREEGYVPLSNRRDQQQEIDMIKLKPSSNHPNQLFNYCNRPLPIVKHAGVIPSAVRRWRG